MQNSRIIANKAEPQKVKSSESVGFNSERDDKYESEPNRRTQKAQKSRRKAQKGDIAVLPRLDSTLGRVGPIRIAQNSTGPVESARRRLDISNRAAPVRAASGRFAPRIYQ